MEKPDHLIAALADEDQRLNELIAGCPPERRERSGPGGMMGPKETIGHLAFWDSFAVAFFTRKLEGAVQRESGVDLERLNKQEMKQLRRRPWEDVLAAYRAATTDLVRFLRAHWRELSDDERAAFLTPLRHRRHHRLLLARSLRETEAAPRARRAQEG